MTQTTIQPQKTHDGFTEPGSVEDPKPVNQLVEQVTSQVMDMFEKLTIPDRNTIVKIIVNEEIAHRSRTIETMERTLARLVESNEDLLGFLRGDSQRLEGWRGGGWGPEPGEEEEQ